MREAKRSSRRRTITFFLMLVATCLGLSAVIAGGALAFNRPAADSPDILGSPVVVTATAGTTGPTLYGTLGAAITAINGGTHQGAITVNINANSTEAGTMVLNSSGAGAASYNSVLIRPVSDGVTVSGASVTGRGLLELNGADNVTIDGDNPNTAGINQNLTFQNTAANTLLHTSVIRIALAATVVNTADNCTFKNLNILGSATGRNISTATSTVGSEFTTFGILASSGASSADPTAPPSIIMGISNAAPSGATATNLHIQNNSVTTVARAIAIQGGATTVFPGLLVENNSIGNPTAGAVDQVYGIGVVAQGSDTGVVRGNTIYVEGWVPSFFQTHGISIGILSAADTSLAFTVERNRIRRVRNNHPTTRSAFGINLGGGNNHVVRNNFVFDVSNDQTAGGSGFWEISGAYGIRVIAGTGHKIYHNSVNLFGLIQGTAGTNLTAAFFMVSTESTGMDVRNNIFSNQMVGGNPSGTRNVAIALPSGGTSAMNLTLNNNDYFQSADANSRMAQVGLIFGTGEFQAANFDPTMTTPATNFRSYSSTLSASGTNDNASKVVNPQFVSDTDLHITAGSPMVDMGASVGVINDIDGQVRVGIPDIGADEFRIAGSLTFDFDGDGKADISVFRPSNATWYISQSSNNAFRAEPFGTTGDRIVPADFDGDGKTDVAVWRPSTGYWYRLDSSTGAFRATIFGQNGDIPAPADFDGDGKADICVFRPSNGTFYLLYSSDGSFHFQQWGQTGDVPLIGDYDGDGKADFSIYRDSISTFYYLRSSDGGFRGIQWGQSADKPVAGDFDGDGKTEIAVYRPSTGAWYAIRSSDNVFTGVGWGTSGDIPSAGDYDGDGKWDVAVFRPSSGVFYILQSTTNSLRGRAVRD